MRMFGTVTILLGILLMGGSPAAAKDKEEFKAGKVHVVAQDVVGYWDHGVWCEGEHCTPNLVPVTQRVYSFYLVKEDGMSVQLQSVLGSSLHGMFTTVSDYDVTYRERGHFVGQLKGTRYVYIVLNGKQGQFYYKELVDPGPQGPEKTR